MKLTITPCSVIQQSQMHQIFVFNVFYYNLKEKVHIRRDMNSKKREMFICEIYIIILIRQKLGLFGPVQQKIKLPLPHSKPEPVYSIRNLFKLKTVKL